MVYWTTLYLQLPINQNTSLVAQTVKGLLTMRETQLRSLGQEDPLEEEIATHSSTLALKIPWTEDRGRLQSMGLQRVDVTEQLHFTSLIKIKSLKKKSVT